MEYHKAKSYFYLYKYLYANLCSSHEWERQHQNERTRYENHLIRNVDHELERIELAEGRTIMDFPLTIRTLVEMSGMSDVSCSLQILMCFNANILSGLADALFQLMSESELSTGNLGSVDLKLLYMDWVGIDRSFSRSLEIQ